MRETLIIGVGHRARHGKDTFCKTIIDRYALHYDVRRYAFADALKEEVDRIGPDVIADLARIPLDPNPDMTDPLCKTKFGKQSRVLQFWGQYMREDNEYHWVQLVRTKIGYDQPRIAIIPDMRYTNEFQYVKSFGGVTVNVNRVGFVDPTRDANHISEVQLDGATYDHVINAHNLEELVADSVEVFERIIAQYAHKPVKELGLV